MTAAAGLAHVLELAADGAEIAARGHLDQFGAFDLQRLGGGLELGEIVPDRGPRAVLAESNWLVPSGNSPGNSLLMALMPWAWAATWLT